MKISALISFLSKIISNGRWPDDVDVWHVNIPIELMDWREVSQFLNNEERLRAIRLIRSEDKLRFALTRAILRVLLSEKTDISIEKLKFELGLYGKPILPDHPMISFNVTHSKQHALIAISNRRHYIGTDIEIIDQSFSWRKLINVVCTESEQKIIALGPRDLQSELFFKCWTAKEALLKAIGIGIAVKRLRCISINPLISSSRSLYYKEYTGKEIRTLQFQWITDIYGYVSCIAFNVKT